MLTQAEVKDHLRIEHENTMHDDLIDRLRDSAASWACSFLNIDTLEEFDDNSPPASPFVVPQDLKSGMLLHVEAMFSRDEAMMERLLKAAENLLIPYRQDLGV